MLTEREEMQGKRSNSLEPGTEYLCGAYMTSAINLGDYGQKMSSTPSDRRGNASMRRAWNSRARSDPLYAIDANRGQRTIDDVYAGGPALVRRMVDPALEKLDVDPSGLRVLEIGCGIGRLFAGLGDRFGEVWGIDISTEMVLLGRQRCPVPATWLIGDGDSLAGIEDDSVDHVLCFEVFGHIPRIEVITAYLSETQRVLRPGGTFQAQFRSGSDSTRQSIVRSLPRSLRVVSGVLLRTLRLLPVQGDIDTWLGTLVSPGEGTNMARNLGYIDVAVFSNAFTELQMPEAGYWLLGRKRIDPPSNKSGMETG
jgi:SAM-dependent methyltransferase